MTSPSGTLHDGMTRPGYVPERQYVSPAVRFTYRPMTIPQRARYFQTLEKQTQAEAREAVTCGMLAMHLVSWTLLYPNTHPIPENRGEPVPHNDADLIYQSVDPYVQRAVAAIVSGMMASAPDPDEKVESQTSEADMQGLSPNEVMKRLAAAEGERVKN